MKRIVTFLTFTLTSVFNSPVNAQVVDTLYEVATWKNFAQSAISYTWDDNTPKQVSDALPLYDRYGFKITFFTITSKGPDWNALKQAKNNGHEIGSHTLTHTALNTLSDADQEKEQKDSQSEINMKMENTECITLAYPFCAGGNRNITANYYASARGCNGQIEKKTPTDFLNVGAIICGAQGAVSTTQEFNSTVNNSISSKGWVVFLLHGINSDGGYSPIDSAELSKHLEYMNDNKEQFWIATYGNVVRYIRERDATSVHELSSTDSLITFSVTNPLDTTIYNFPLTLKRQVPVNWASFTIYQKGTPIPLKIINENGKQYIVFDVIPNAGSIMIKRNGTVSTADHFIVSSFIIYPNPFVLTTNIQFELKQAAQVYVELFDEKGKKIKSRATEMYSAGQHEIVLNTSNLPQNLFYIAFYVGGQMWTKKVISIK